MRRHLVSAAALGASIACLSAAGPQRQATPSFDGARAYEHIRQIVAIGPRPAGSAALQRARDYIAAQLKAAGLTADEQAFEAATPIGPIRMVNVRSVVPGSNTSKGRLVIAGHYDTKLFKDFVFVGANDGGSSAAFLLELGRVLKMRSNALPIELLFLDGEEAVVEWEGDDHTYGSRHYVNAARMDGTLRDIRALVLVDMIGDRSLRLLRESNSTPWLTETIWAAARRLNRPEFADAEMPVEDDHIEFLRAGVPAVDLIDLDYPDDTRRYWHTPEDTLDKVSAASLQVVADVLLAALPDIEKRLVAR